MTDAPFAIAVYGFAIYGVITAVGFVCKWAYKAYLEQRERTFLTRFYAQIDLDELQDEYGQYCVQCYEKGNIEPDPQYEQYCNERFANEEDHRHDVDNPKITYLG